MSKDGFKLLFATCIAGAIFWQDPEARVVAWNAAGPYVLTGLQVFLQVLPLLLQLLLLVGLAKVVLWLCRTEYRKFKERQEAKPYGGPGRRD